MINISLDFHPCHRACTCCFMMSFYKIGLGKQLRKKIEASICERNDIVYKKNTYKKYKVLFPALARYMSAGRLWLVRVVFHGMKCDL